MIRLIFSGDLVFLSPPATGFSVIMKLRIIFDYYMRLVGRTKILLKSPDRTDIDADVLDVAVDLNTIVETL